MPQCCKIDLECKNTVRLLLAAVHCTGLVQGVIGGGLAEEGAAERSAARAVSRRAQRSSLSATVVLFLLKQIEIIWPNDIKVQFKIPKVEMVNRCGRVRQQNEYPKFNSIKQGVDGVAYYEISNPFKTWANFHFINM